MEQTKEAMQKEMARLKAYYPWRVVWGAIDPKTGEFECGATPTKRRPNDWARKGREVYIWQN